MATTEEKIIISVDLDAKVLQTRLGDVRDQISNLRKVQQGWVEDLKKTALGTEEYNKLSQIVGENEQKIKALTREASTLNQALDGSAAAAGSYNKVAASASVLEKQLKESAVGINITQEAYDKLVVKVKEANQAKLAFSKTIADLKGQIGNYPSIVNDSTASIEQLKDKYAELSAMQVKLPINSAEFAKNKEELEKLKVSIGSAEGKLDEFGNREPKDKLKKHFEDAGHAVEGFVGLSELAVLVGGKNETAEMIQTKALQGLAIMQALSNVRKGIEGTINTFRLIQSKLLVTAMAEETTAQEGVNAAMDANPIGAIIVAVVALIAAITALVYWFSKSNDEVENAQKKYDSMKESTEKLNAATENHIKILEAQGASEHEIAKAKEEQIDRNIELAKQQLKIDLIKINDIKNNDSIYESILRGAAAVARFFGAEQTAEAYEKEIQANKMDRAKEVLDAYSKDKQAYDDLVTDKKVVEITDAKDSVKIAQDAADKKLQINRKLQEELNKLLVESQQREIAAVKLDLQKSLDDIKGKSKAENDLRAAYEEVAQQEIAKIKKKYSDEEVNRMIEDETVKLQLQIQLLEEGNKERLSKTLQLLDDQQDLELSKVVEGTAQTEEQKANIEEKYRQLKLAAQKDFDIKIADQAAKDRIATLQAQIQDAQVAGQAALSQQMALALAERDQLLLNDKLTAAERLKIESDYNKKVDDINKAAQAQKIKDYQDAMATIQSIIGVATNYFKESQKQETDAMVAGLDARLQAGTISQAAYDTQRKSLLRKQAQDEKNLAIFDAVIAGAAAVVKALPNVPLSIIAGVTAASQIALIASKPIPAFAFGGLSGQRIGWGDGLPSQGANGDNLLARVRVGEVILNESQQARLGGARTFASIGVPGFADGGLTARVASTPVQGSFNLTNQFRYALDSLPPPILILEDFADQASKVAQVKTRADI